MHKILVVTRYQVKLLYRDWTVRLCALIMIVIVPVAVWGGLYIVSRANSAMSLPSFIPFWSSILFDFFQSLFVIFVAYDIAIRNGVKKSLEMIYARPVSNVGYLLGKTVAVLLFFVGLNVFILLVGIGCHLYDGNTPMQLWMYLFYLLTLTLPSLLFWLGISSFVGGVSHKRGGMLIVLLLWGVSCFYLSDICHGVFNYSAGSITNLFSDVVGNPLLGEYLLHRSCYFLAGIGFWCFSVLGFKRLENHFKTPFRLTLAGGLCLLLAGYAGWRYNYYYEEIDGRREEYREVYIRNYEKDRVRASAHEIECAPVGDSLYAKSRISVCNPSDMIIQEFVLFLNPWLTVDRLTDGEREIPFTRDGQVVVVRHTLMPKEEATLVVEYSGKVDGAICYLELNNKDYYHREYPTPIDICNRFMQVGQVYVFLSSDFTLLYPDCLWYPSTAAPENLCTPCNRECDFTRYTLAVRKRDGVAIVSQGKAEDVGDRMIFRNAECLPGISLCVGDFARWELETDSLNVELYRFRDHDFFIKKLESLEGTPDEVLADNLDYWKREYRRDYPFKEFKAIETPVCFASHKRRGSGSNNYLQPGMLFWPERGVTLGYNSGSIYNVTVDAVSLTIYDLLLVNMYMIHPLFDEFTGRIVDKRYPGIDLLFSEITRRGRVLEMQRDNPLLIESCVNYLSCNSLQSAGVDENVTEEEFRCMACLSADCLNAYLTACSDDGVLISFWQDFWENHRFQRVDFDEFSREYMLKTGVDIGKIVAGLYTRKELPRFRIESVRKNGEEISMGEGPTATLWSYKVYNDSGVDGVISVFRGMEDSEWGFRQQYFSYVIPAKSCREIRVIKFDNKMEHFSTHLSQHLPLSFRKESVIDEGMRGEVGVFECDTVDFIPESDEIIVDDQDEGFKLALPETKLHLSKWFREEKKGNYNQIEIPFYPEKWARVYRYQFYGFPRQSAWCKMVGKGKGKASWQATLDKAGQYEVFAYVPELYVWGMDRQPDGMTMFYTVVHAGEETEVILELQKGKRGWVSLGVFYFNAGDTKVILSDRTTFGSSDARREMWVVADAMKWKYISK